MKNNILENELEPHGVCEYCEDTGIRDTGGEHPWGEAIHIPCECKEGLPDETITIFKAGYTAGQASTEGKPTARDALQAIADISNIPTYKWDYKLDGEYNIFNAEIAGQETAYRAVEALFSTPPEIVCRKPNTETKGFNLDDYEYDVCPQIGFQIDELERAFNKGYTEGQISIGYKEKMIEEYLRLEEEEHQEGLNVMYGSAGQD